MPENSTWKKKESEEMRLQNNLGRQPSYREVREEGRVILSPLKQVLTGCVWCGKGEGQHGELRVITGELHQDARVRQILSA